MPKYFFLIFSFIFRSTCTLFRCHIFLACLKNCQIIHHLIFIRLLTKELQMFTLQFIFLIVIRRQISLSFPRALEPYFIFPLYVVEHASLCGALSVVIVERSLQCCLGARVGVEVVVRSCVGNINQTQTTIPL